MICMPDCIGLTQSPASIGLQDFKVTTLQSFHFSANFRKNAGFMTFSAFYARNGVEKQVFNGKFGDGLRLTGKSSLTLLISVMVVLKTPINMGILP